MKPVHADGKGTSTSRGVWGCFWRTGAFEPKGSVKHEPLCRWTQEGPGGRTCDTRPSGGSRADSARVLFANLEFILLHYSINVSSWYLF